MWTLIRLLQEQSDLDVHGLSEDSKTFQQTTKQTSFEVMGTLRLLARYVCIFCCVLIFFQN